MTLPHQYALSIRKDIDAAQDYQSIRVQRDYQDTPRVDLCDETCPLAYYISYVSLLPLGLDVICVFGTLEMD